MAETLTATSPLQGYRDKFANVPPSVELSEEPFVAMLDLRVDPDGPAASEASAILGLAPPNTPSTCVQHRHPDGDLDGARRVADHRRGLVRRRRWRLNCVRP